MIEVRSLWENSLHYPHKKNPLDWLMKHYGDIAFGALFSDSTSSDCVVSHVGAGRNRANCNWSTRTMQSTRIEKRLCDILLHTPHPSNMSSILKEGWVKKRSTKIRKRKRSVPSSHLSIFPSSERLFLSTQRVSEWVGRFADLSLRPLILTAASVGINHESVTNIRESTRGVRGKQPQSNNEVSCGH